MKNTDRIADYILDDIKSNVPFGTNNFTDEEINEKSNYDLLNHWLNWNGIIGYTGTILGVIREIYDTELEDKGEGEY